MANPTTNFGWQMPTSTDLVTDLPADFEVFGQAVDTSLVDLKGGTTGQVLSKASNTDMDFTWVAQDDSNAIQNAIVDAKGDLITATAADTPARLAVGTNGQTLVADSSTATGLKWAAPSSGALTLVKAETAFSAVANTGTTFDGVFSSAYNNYLIIINQTLNSIDGESFNFNMRYSTGTTDSDAANTGGTYVKNSSGTDGSWYFNNATTMKLFTNQNTAGRFGTCNLWIGGLNSGSASRYQMNWQFATPGNNQFGNGGNVQNSNGTTRIWTGFILTASSGTISGTATVYGFGKA